MNLEDLPNNNLITAYFEHALFEQLQKIHDFYNSLSYTTMNFHSLGTRAIFNLDMHVFSSIAGTIDSIREVLLKGRINDAYALLRKYYDSTIINVYTNLYLNDHFNLDNFIVDRIDSWRNGKEKMPKFWIISKYIKDSPKLKPITNLLQKDKLYSDIRQRCNDHMHYNYYHNLLLNDNQIYNDKRINTLDTFLSDIIAVFIQHFSYLFYLNDHYMMSSDFSDSRDVGLTPDPNSQYWVAGFIQDVFDKIVKPNRSDIANEIKTKTEMDLE